MGKFAYDMLDIRARPEFENAVGVMVTTLGYQEGAKRIAIAEDIAIAVHGGSEDGALMCLLEGKLPWLSDEEHWFSGQFFFRDRLVHYQTPGDFLVNLGDSLGRRREPLGRNSPPV